jgi:hypothetical protein
VGSDSEMMLTTHTGPGGDLNLRFYLDQPVLDDEQVRRLQHLLGEYLPQWASGLRVIENESQRQGIPALKDLPNAIRAVVPEQRSIGNAILIGAYAELKVYLFSCSSTVPAELNYLAIEVLDRCKVEGISTWDWAQSFFEAVVSTLPTRYACARLTPEFEEKNLIKNQGGVRAVGVRLDRAVPGLYWLNYFGADYVRLMEKIVLLSAPAYEAKQIGDGVLVSLGADPTEWQTSVYRDREKSIIEHLGQQFFFTKANPDRETLAPVFEWKGRRRRERG